MGLCQPSASMVSERPEAAFVDLPLINEAVTQIGPTTVIFSNRPSRRKYMQWIAAARSVAQRMTPEVLLSEDESESSGV